MKLTVLKNNLRSGLSLIERGIAESSNLPILKHILIKTVNNKIKLDATNLELAITTSLPGKIIENGSITVPFSTFYSVISNLNSERIDLEVKNNNLLVTTDNYEAKIQGIAESEFPIIPKIEKTDEFLEIDTTLLKETLIQVSCAAQISEIMPEISGVLIVFADNQLKFVATDSFRLAEKTISSNKYKTNFAEPFKIIIPLKTIQEVIRISTATGPTTIHKDANQILFKNENTELISRLIDGTYPDYEQIIPKGVEMEVSVEREALMQAVKLVSSFSGKVNDLHVKIDGGKKAIEVYSSNQYVGENHYLVPAKIKQNETADIVFNWKYLLDGLKAIPTTQLLLHANGETKPALLKPVDDISYFYIVMPIRNS